MTQEAEDAKAASRAFEGWKHRTTEQSGGKYRVSFDVKNDEFPEELFMAPVGARFMIVVVPLNDDETPKMDHVLKPKSYAGQAKLLATKPGFNEFAFKKYPMFAKSFLEENPDPEDVLEYICGVMSCSEIVEGTKEAGFFKDLQRDYFEWERHGTI